MADRNRTDRNGFKPADKFYSACTWRARGPKGSRRTMRMSGRTGTGEPGIRPKAVVTGTARSAAPDMFFYHGPLDRSWKKRSKARRQYARYAA